jgi:hypothetical protein
MSYDGPQIKVFKEIANHQLVIVNFGFFKSP